MKIFKKLATKKNKLRVGILFGGKSSEHEVSLMSAKSIIQAIDRSKYEPILIGISRLGSWFLLDEGDLGNMQEVSEVKLESSKKIVLALQGEGETAATAGQDLGQLVDVIFPVLHGSFGEDGTVQGFLKIANLPFVGASVLGSAIGMDKDVMKRLLKEAGIPVANFLVFREEEVLSYELVVQKLGVPFFVKPANTGSSVGISKVANEAAYTKAIQEAFRYDRKVLVEEGVEGREIECSVLGNSQPVASIPGEIIPHDEFYSYKAKYLDAQGATLEIPAKLDGAITKKIQTLAVTAFKILECEGLGRVDFFLKQNGEILVNEINTIPGFTSVSMYPKLWEASGISYPELIDRLIQLALEKFRQEQKLKTFLAR